MHCAATIRTGLLHNVLYKLNNYSYLLTNLFIIIHRNSPGSVIFIDCMNIYVYMYM